MKAIPCRLLNLMEIPLFISNFKGHIVSWLPRTMHRSSCVLYNMVKVRRNNLLHFVSFWPLMQL